jgi:hypothetical protein
VKQQLLMDNEKMFNEVLSEALKLEASEPQPNFQ